MDKRVVLASKSPRRKELLGRLIPEFEIEVDDSEEVMDMSVPPEEAVKRLAVKKAENVAKKIQKDALIISADTTVFIDGEILGKPKDEKNAKEMLRCLSGREHYVSTGICVYDTKSGKLVSDFERTAVRFRYISDDEIEGYIKSGEPMDKAGAYGIQNLGALFVEGIKGDYFNVVGLPLFKLGRLLKDEFDISFI